THESKDAAWTWAETSFGPTVLIKHRLEIQELSSGNWPRVRSGVGRPTSAVNGRTLNSKASHPVLFEPDAPPERKRPRPVDSGRKRGAASGALDIDELLAVVQTSG